MGLEPLAKNEVDRWDAWPRMKERWIESLGNNEVDRSNVWPRMKWMDEIEHSKWEKTETLIKKKKMMNHF